MLKSDILKGAYDLHIHAAPSPFHRALDDYGLLEEAAHAGMAGILLKSHYESTAARATLVNTHSSAKTIAYGALALNWPVGGLNPHAVHNALIRGAKIIFMPTRDSANSLQFGNMKGDFFDRPGITVVDENRKLKKEVFEIMDIVKQYNAVLATGHLSPSESILLCKEGIKNNVRMILTHPEFSRTKISTNDQIELADAGVYIEKCWYNIGERECTAQEMAKNIQIVGAEHCFMTTDRGQDDRELPVEAMESFISALQKNGIGDTEIDMMIRTVPAKIVNT